MRVECIAVGTELLTTRRLDTNSVWIAERLAGLGLELARKTCVGDDREGLKDLFREALDRSDLVIATGGLGPTFDDFTKEVVAELAGAELKEDAACREALVALFASRNLVPAASNFKQVLVPVGAEPLPNPIGSAPGIWWAGPGRWAGRTVVLLPGVPREMKRMWTEQVEPRLEQASGAEPLHTLRLVVTGVPESALDQRIEGIRARHGSLAWTILASLTQVELVLRGPDRAALAAAGAELEAELGEDLACVGDQDLEGAVLEQLGSRGHTLALAESMTGGLLAARLTAIPGASRALLGGATVYSPAAKVELAGADPALLAQQGTVSEAVTRALAQGIRRRLGATWALAVTGNAGPTADVHGKDAALGTGFVALEGPQVSEVRTLVPFGERTDAQLRACAVALDLLRRHLVRG